MKHIAMKHVAKSLLLLGFLTAFGGPVLAADAYPSKAVYCMIPWSAGGGTDTTIRGFLKAAEPYVGTDFNCANVTGGGGAVGWTELRHAKADGYTLGAATYDVLTHSAKARPPFTIDDFVSVVGISQYPLVVAVKADAPWQTLDELIAHIRAQKGDSRIGIGAIAGSQHQLLYTIEKRLDIKTKPVPFKGGAEIIAAVLGDTIEAGLITSPEAKNRPDLKILAQFAKTRHDDLPDAPTAKELGIDIVFGSFRGIIVPAATPKDRVAFLREKFDQAWHDQKFLDWATKAGVSPSYMSGADLDELLAAMLPDVKTALKAINKQ